MFENNGCLCTISIFSKKYFAKLHFDLSNFLFYFCCKNLIHIFLLHIYCTLFWMSMLESVLSCWEQKLLCELLLWLLLVQGQTMFMYVFKKVSGCNISLKKIGEKKCNHHPYPTSYWMLDMWIFFLRNQKHNMILFWEEKITFVEILLKLLSFKIVMVIVNSFEMILRYSEFYNPMPGVCQQF